MYRFDTILYPLLFRWYPLIAMRAFTFYVAFLLLQQYKRQREIYYCRRTRSSCKRSPLRCFVLLNFCPTLVSHCTLSPWFTLRQPQRTPAILHKHIGSVVHFCRGLHDSINISLKCCSQVERVDNNLSLEHLVNILRQWLSPQFKPSTQVDQIPISFTEPSIS